MGCIRDVCLVLLVFTFVCKAEKYKEQALKLMSETPLIDGHNDLPWQLRSQFNNQLNTVDLYTLNSTHTNIPKIKEGHLAAQFWAAYVPCATQYKDAVRQTLEQIDIIHRMCNKYPEDFMLAVSSQDILDAFANNKIASLIGVEGGHSIDSSMGTLRTMYKLGVRYLTLTHSCNTPWADNWLVDTSSDPIEHNGLSDFGKKSNNGIVMVNFYNDYVTCSQKATLSHVADHFDHIKKVAGSSIVGFGGDYDGVTRLPTGLEDVSKYPDLVAELLRRGWTDDEVKDALGRNLIRVFKAVETVRDRLNNTDPDDVPIPLEQVQNQCRTSYGYKVPPNAAAMPSHSSLILFLTLILYSLIVNSM